MRRHTPWSRLHKPSPFMTSYICHAPRYIRACFRVHLIGHLLCEFELFVEISAVDRSLLDVLVVDELPDLSDELPDVPPIFPPDLIILHIF
jgi:hypothetical protein